MVTEPIGRNNSVRSSVSCTGSTSAPHLDIHLIMDNGSSHTSRATRAWIAARPRIKVTYTPKHASWLDMAELWFSVLTRRLLTRGEFTSRAELADKITGFTIRHNRTAHPWTWTYDARADHAAYIARRARIGLATITGPTTAQALPEAASPAPPTGNSTLQGLMRRCTRGQRGR